LKKTLLILFYLFSVTYALLGQKKEVLNLQQVDYKPMHFGFVLGLHTQDFSLRPSGVADANGVVWKGEVASPSPGFTVGMITDFRLAEYFSLRFIPTLNFGDRNITFAGFKDGAKVDSYTTNVLSTLVSLPFYIKYRSLRLNNYRPYLIAGAGPMFDLARKKDLDILLKPVNFCIEFGVGCDCYLPFFKLAPEFKMNIGFNNLIERDRPMIANEQNIKYTEAISRLTSRLFILTFNFE